MNRNVTSFGKAMLIPYLAILFFLVFPNTGFSQKQLQIREVAKSQKNTVKDESSKSIKSQPQVIHESPLEQFKNKKEDVTKRDLFSKHFINGDGSNTAMIGVGPIHYSKNGQFLDIDHTITRSTDANYPYANTTNLFESHFGVTAHKGVKNNTVEGEIIEFLNTKMYWEVTGHAVNIINSNNSSITIENNKAYYNNLYGNINAEFIVKSGRRKLNYVIPSRQALGSIPIGAEYLVFTEDVVLPNGWNYKVHQMNGITLYSPNGKAIYSYQNPTSTDALNELSQEVNTIYKASLSGNILTIETKVKIPWLLDNTRVFPIKVDPTIDVYPNQTSHRTGQTFPTGGGYGDIAVGYAGGYYRGFATFDTTSIPDGSTISTTTLYHNVGTTTGMGTARGSELRAYLGLPQDQGSFSNLYNAITNATISPNIYQTVYNIGATGWKNITLGATANTHLSNRLNVNNFTIGYRPAGTYSGTNQYALIYGMPDPGNLNREPYLSVTYTAPNVTLTISNAGTGASYNNGTHTMSPNTSVTVTAGSNPGFSLAGWIGTGSAPASGTGNTATFTITQNSSITWNWVTQTVTGIPIFHNTGGAEQLTFNNSRIVTDTPVFRISHGINPATNYQITIQDASASFNLTETFTGTFAANTETNFTMTQTAGYLTPGQTYYVTARTSGDGGATYSNYSSLLYSFTYEPTTTITHWFQTEQRQLATATVNGVTANINNNLVLTATGGNVITNGSFESGMTGWTISRPGTWITVASEAYGNTVGTNALNIYNNNPSSTGNFNGDTAGAYQTLNMTGVSTISLDLGYESTSGSNLNVNVEVYISETNQTSLRTGQLILNWRPTLNLTTGNSFSIDVSPYNFTGNKLIKIVTYLTIPSTDFVERYFYIDNIQALASPSGTATSTPFELASVHGAAKYDKIEWTQSLNGGQIAMKLQSSTDGANWSDIPGFTNITYTGDGLKVHDVTNAPAAPYLRIAATLSGIQGVSLHDWAIYAKEPCEAMITSVTADNNNICAGTNAELTAVANNPSHAIRWYATATGGTVLATGTTFNTPNLSATTTYYAEADNGICKSDVRQPITITVNAIPNNITVAIGTPANGTNHYINVSWVAISGATQYQIDYSWDNTNWSTGGFSTTTSYNLNLFDNPNRQVYIRVKRYDNGGLPDCFAYANPIYTAADTPAILLLNNPAGTSMQVTIPAEIPVVNPAITTYSLYNETLQLYVQANGSLGVTEVFQTKTAWGTVTVTGLTAETEYCFYAKAKNEDGDVRFTPPATLSPTQEFNSNVLTTGGTAPSNSWFAPNSNSPFAHSVGGCNGGRVGYALNTTATWGNFLRTPVQDLSGMTEVTLGFTISNSYNASNTTGNYVYLNYWDTAYRSNNVTSIKINGNPYTTTGTTGGRINFDELRECAYVEITFTLNPANNLSQVYFYFNAAKANTTGFHFYLDDFKMAQGDSFSSPDTVCLSTGPDCDATITSVTNGSGCAGIALQAAGSASTTEYLWYDAQTGGNLVATTVTGQWTTPVLSNTTTYYVAASNGTCESARTAVTATVTPTAAEMMFWTPSATSCQPVYVMLYAETMDDNSYQVNWYTTATGGTPFHTGYDLNYYINNTITLYVSATDGTCESVREPIQITLEGRIWNGSISTDWSNANNWTPASIPTLNECVTIPATANNPIVTANVEAKSLSILADAELLVITNASITVRDEVNVAATANFTLENDGYLKQITGGQTNNNIGKITVHKNSAPMFRLDATAWSSPVENQRLYAFSPETVSGRIYEYNENTNAWDNTTINNNSVFVPAKGYSIRSANNYPTYTPTATPEVFEGVFTGKPFNGTIGINVTNNNKGNNYIGNPYPSPIDAYAFLSNNASVEGLYFWTHEAPPINGVYAANNYASYTTFGATASAAGGEIPDGIINVGQGFVIKTNQSVLLQFTNDLREISSNGQFFRRAQTEKHRFWLNLSDSQANYNQILLGYMEGASNAFDHKIDGKFFGHTGSAIYSLIDTEKYVIQGRSLPFDSQDIIPLGFRAMQQGIFKIGLDRLDGLFLNGQTIYLKDKLNNITHNLSEGDYSFISEVGTFENRFEITYVAESLGVNNPEMNNNNWIVFKADNKITIQSKGFDIESIEVYDITGRLLIQKDNINSNTYSCPAYFADQVLIVKINKILSKKVL